jgi:hypothetical protein
VGNPLFLRPDYTSKLLAKISQLSILDDTSIAELRIESVQTEELTVVLNCTQCRGLILPGQQTNQIGDKPPDEYDSSLTRFRVSLEAGLHGFDQAFVSKSMPIGTSVDFEMCQGLKFPVSMELFNSINGIKF